MRSMLVVAVLSSAAHADDVNLLTATPTTLAVSSTVANARILPDHLVDGKLSTAWNSQTGELAGAWIAVRVPAEARVKTIKLTAGFTHKDKRLGDLFTLNPRIRKVQITWDGGTKRLVKTLDVENRGLQEIAVDIPGGDFEIRVVEVVPGKKKNWRETCVSELEVWGSVPAIVKSKPSVRMRSLDAPPTLTREQCIAAVGKVAGKITNVEVIRLSDDHVICRVDHKEKGSTDTTSEIAAVKRGPKPALIDRVTETFTVEDRGSEGSGDTGSVQLVVFPLRTFENALLVHASQSQYGPMRDAGKTRSKLYRVTATALDELLAYESTWDVGESSESDRCELAAEDVRKTMPNLVLSCETQVGHWHDDNPDDRGIETKERTVRYRWRNEKYEAR